MRRHSVLRCVFVACTLGGCTAAGSDNQVFGPVFEPADAATADAATPDAAVAIDATADVAIADAAADTPSPIDAPLDAPACDPRLAIVAGGATSAQGAVGRGASWSVASLGNGVSQPPSVAAFGSGFHAVLVRIGGATQQAAFTAAWSTPQTIGSMSARDFAPLAAPSASALHLVMQATDYKYFHGIFGGTSWDGVSGAVGNPQSFGPRGPAAVGLAGKLVIAQAGGDDKIYDQTWDGAWQAAHGHTASSAENTIRPAITALDGGTADLMIVYANKTNRHLQYMVRSGGTWSNPATVYQSQSNTAFSNEPAALVARSGGRAILVFMGTDGKPYASDYDPGRSAVWREPAAIANVTVASPPQLVRVCGADAVAALPTGGGVSISRLSGTTWSAPLAIAGLTGVTSAAIAAE